MLTRWALWPRHTDSNLRKKGEECFVSPMLQDGQAKEEWLSNLPNISQLVNDSIRTQTQAGWLHGSRWASFATIRVSNRGLANARRLANYGLGLVRQHTAVSLALGGTQLSVPNLEGTGRRLLRAGDQPNSYSQLQASLDYNLPISKERRKRKAISQSP